ncbi:di-heme-cytochrome C peroxidase [Pseudoalteromonas sp. MMG022]|uniref:di-heme-cytochrome C peroxidase n=1 Tax=Pseudoalteromonas sp. MMG022 TaxID=2909978 RepID=UPI001F2B89EF|nr:di-heme-cytochrome C peroxidase [Pseudoalteromonas sp. MMG022]MCF6434046.1 di-heme-cytochrome C peroxidase [Pseudoalteromonas sp. MMG022]
MSKLHFAAALSVVGLLTAIGCTTNRHTAPPDPIQVTPEQGQVPDRTWLDQGWSQEISENFWFTNQGSQIIPYTWFVWLEQADSTQLFRHSEHMESLRYLPSKASEKNPGGLPIGFARHSNQTTGENWVGMTCAACHTNQIDYKGTKILVDGAPTLANFVLFFDRLVAALNKTLNEEAKFERFARNVLGSGYNATTKNDLKQRLQEIALQTAQRQAVNALPKDYPQDFTSYARLDAFGNIQNAGTAFALNDLTNKNAPTGPVSYPFLWGTHQSDVVQWNASAPNTPIVGPLVRNIGEVVGVFGELEIKEAPFIQRVFGKHARYSSTVDMIGLGNLESWVKTLRSPQWPLEYFPAIDTEKAAKGAILYKQECASCHQVIPRDKEHLDYIANQTLISELGTDPVTANNASCHMAKTLFLEGTKERILIGSKFQAVDNAIDIPVNGVVGLVLKDLPLALKAGNIPERTDANGNKISVVKELENLLVQHLKKRGEKADEVEADCVDGVYDGGVYKGRPLNGIWATAPYLHNGSVPNLYELMKKPEQRVTEFWVGSREFDPVNVGFDTTAGLNKFKVNGSGGKIMPGNSNRGHSYGTDLNDEQKWQVIEYMKTL